MRKNRSPWLAQLNAHRKHARLGADLKTDIVIVGAGIAGVATAFFALKHTEKKVVILEKSKLAHGATGHNAGQIDTYFEKGFLQIIEEFGPELAKHAQSAVNEARGFLEEMYTEAGSDIFFSREMGHDGYSTYEQLLRLLEEARLKREMGLETEHISIALTAPFLDKVPALYAGLYRAVPQEQILEMLETKSQSYLILVSSRKGLMNVALLCERVIEYLYKTYPARFSLYEDTLVRKLLLKEAEAVLDADTYTVSASRAVLCTNGFEDFHIINENGLAVDTRFHHSVEGKVAYMSAYMEETSNAPTVTSYEMPENSADGVLYYYLTRRSYAHEDGREHTLVSIGGPEDPLERLAYSRDWEFPERAFVLLERFIREVYAPEKAGRIEHEFAWHGLMGYTQNGMRMIGPEPKNPVLLYNLGCNGVGILPSVMGGRRIARYLAGEQVEKSAFDVPERIGTPVSAEVNLQAKL